jgi:hypothetical protein
MLFHPTIQTRCPMTKTKTNPEPELKLVLVPVPELVPAGLCLRKRCHRTP